MTLLVEDSSRHVDILKSISGLTLGIFPPLVAIELLFANIGFCCVGYHHVLEVITSLATSGLPVLLTIELFLADIALE